MDVHLVPKTVQQREQVTREVCDFCGTELHRNTTGNADEVEIQATLGDCWPSGDCREVEVFDCCVKCWRAKVRPALEALGGRCWTYDADEGRTRTMPLDES